MFDSALPQNNLLAALSAKTLHAMTPKLERVELKFSEQIYGKDDVFSHVYFVESGIISMLASDGEHSTIEVAMIGHEGMAPPSAFLGIKRSTCCSIVQGEGTAIRMTVEDFLAECAENNDLSRVMGLFTNSIIEQLTRSAICNHFHTTESRLARWLLMTQDRMRSDDFKITQEILSYMVGVRREAINKSATSFARRNLISYTRGHMSITDRKGLEDIACNCYGMLTISV